MAWTLTHDIDAYRAAAGELLGSQPERNTVLLSVLASLTGLGPAACGDAAPLFGWWPAGGAVRAAVLQTPPHPMLLTDLPGAVSRCARRGTGRPRCPAGWDQRNGIRRRRAWPGLAAADRCAGPH